MNERERVHHASERERGSGGTKSPGLPIDGTVLAVLPRALYRVALAEGREIVAHAAAGAGRNFVRLVVGDRVKVELTARDMNRGRIVKRA